MTFIQVIHLFRSSRSYSLECFAVTNAYFPLELCSPICGIGRHLRTRRRKIGTALGLIASSIINTLTFKKILFFIDTFSLILINAVFRHRVSIVRSLPFVRMLWTNDSNSSKIYMSCFILSLLSIAEGREILKVLKEI